MAFRPYLFFGGNCRDAFTRYQEIFAQPMVGMVGMLLVWRVFGQIFRPLFLFCVNLLYPGTPYG